MRLARRIPAAAWPATARRRPDGRSPPRPVLPAPSAGARSAGRRRVTVRFGDLVANDEVSLVARTGMVTALIGPNGAGKTTFFNVLTGAVRPTAGPVRVFGEDVGPLTPSKAARLGVIRTFQNLKVLPRLTVLENVAIGAGPRPHRRPARHPGRHARRPAPGREARREAAEWALDFVQVGAPPRRPGRRPALRGRAAGGDGPGAGRRSACPAPRRADRRDGPGRDDRDRRPHRPRRRRARHRGVRGGARHAGGAGLRRPRLRPRTRAGSSPAARRPTCCPIPGSSRSTSAGGGGGRRA